MWGAGPKNLWLRGGARSENLGLSTRLEGVLDPLDGGRWSIRIAHDEDIEAHGQPGELAALLQQLTRGPRDAPLLAPRAPRLGPAVGVAAARAHLGNHQHIAGECHDVELTEPAAVIA